MLLTRSPLAARLPRAAARLACVKHSASVQSEPGSNSSVQSLFDNFQPQPKTPAQAKSRRREDVATTPSLHSKQSPRKLLRVSTTYIVGLPHTPPALAHQQSIRHSHHQVPTPIGCKLLKSELPASVSRSVSSKDRALYRPRNVGQAFCRYFSLEGRNTASDNASGYFFVI
jgi:hypothetical protein